MLSSRISTHVLIKTFLSFCNQYFNWFMFWMWKNVLASSDTSSRISIKMIDTRRSFLLDRLDSTFNDSDSIDSIDCLSLETIFSWIMIASSADDFCRYDLNWCSLDARLSFWLIQDSVIEILLQMIDRVLNNNEIWKFCIVSE
jgi:hypothetical protein